ncbi:MAG: glycerol kinase GlpK [Candidatus Cloacimonetes bacterium]|nr:glycerol kinase GlpK [Candidatus Cloacimonadota bacterium]
MSEFIMALDQGTTSSRTIIFNKLGEIISMATEPLQCHYPQSGWVEQIPSEIWQGQLKTMKEALKTANLQASDIRCIGITNQRETVIAWDKTTGQALNNAIVWQCRRTADFCEELKAEGFDSKLKQKTGLVTDAYFSGTKMRWLLQNNPAVKKCADDGNLLFGTVDSWLVYNLTKGEKHISDASNASRTLVYNIHDKDWDQEILERFEIPRSALPTVVDSSQRVGECHPDFLGSSIVISGIAGDQQSALFGQLCLNEGMAKNTYGTGCFLLMNTGDKAVNSQNGLLTTIAWSIGGKTTYALEGAVFIGGALVQWLRDELQIIEDAALCEEMALKANPNSDVYIVPAFVGLGAPYWDPYARGTMHGLTRDTSREDIVKASLNAIALQSRDVLECMQQDLQKKLSILKVDGGASANNYLMQFQADINQCTVSRPTVVETTAMGAAYLAGLAAGVYKDFDELTQLAQEGRAFEPSMADTEAKKHTDYWKKAIERSKNWIEA